MTDPREIERDLIQNLQPLLNVQGIPTKTVSEERQLCFKILRGAAEYVLSYDSPELDWFFGDDATDYMHTANDVFSLFTGALTADPPPEGFSSDLARLYAHAKNCGMTKNDDGSYTHVLLPNGCDCFHEIDSAEGIPAELDEMMPDWDDCLHQGDNSPITPETQITKLTWHEPLDEYYKTIYPGWPHSWNRPTINLED